MLQKQKYTGSPRWSFFTPARRCTMEVLRPDCMICRLWIMGEMNDSHPRSVRKPAALRVPASMTARAASNSGLPSASAPSAAAIMAPAISPAWRMTAISSLDLIIRMAPSRGEMSSGTSPGNCASRWLRTIAGMAAASIPTRPGFGPSAPDRTLSQRRVPASSQVSTFSTQVIADTISLSMSGVITTGGSCGRTNRKVGRPNSTDR